MRGGEGEREGTHQAEAFVEDFVPFALSVTEEHNLDRLQRGRLCVACEAVRGGAQRLRRR